MNSRNCNKKPTHNTRMVVESNADSMPSSINEGASISNSSLDLLEKHQAREQARLLQRFRELREWQQQQQQQLMQQQQQQLRTWQDEQSKVQTLIASQGGKAIKPPADSSRSPLMTPPTKPRPSQAANQVTDSVSQSQMAGISLDSGLVVSMQDTLKSQSSLPKPIMYPALEKGDEGDEDKYTTSELFSNLGSHDELQDRVRDMDEESKPLPDWMSDSSENVLRGSQLPPPRALKGGNQLAGLEQLLKTAPAGLLQQMLGLLPGGRGQEAQAREGRTPEDVELSASPTLAPRQEPSARRLLSYPASTVDEERPDRANGSSPDLPNQQQQLQSKKLQLQLQQQQQQLMLLQQKQHEAFQHQQNQMQRQQKHQQHHNPVEHQFPRNGFKLGPTASDPDVDPQFVPRVFSLNDNGLQRPAWLNGHDRKGEEESDGEGDKDEDYYGNQYEEDDEEQESAFEEEEEDEEEEEEDLVKQGSKHTTVEDRPISGIGGRKTFEELLEEQLCKEKEELQQKNEESGAPRKVPFLKKGEGIARFNSAPKKPPPKKSSSSKSQSRSFHSSDLSSGSGRGEPARTKNGEGGSRKSSVGSRFKSMGKSTASENSCHGEKRGFVRKVQPNQSSPEERPIGKLNLIRSVANKKLEEQQKHTQQKEQPPLQSSEQDKYNGYQRDTESVEQPFFRAPGPKSLGDLNTIVEQSPSLDGRSTIMEDHDSTELDSLAEFEVLEEAADNMSLCSSSSLVGRLVYGDRQGQKEAVQKLKTITESLKSARSEASASGLGEREIGNTSTAAAANSNNNNNNNNYRHEEAQIKSSLNKDFESKNGRQDRESLEVTLTESSEDEDDDDGKLIVAHHPHEQKEKEKRKPNSPPATESNGFASNALTSQEFMPSPSKALTRKVAPLSSKFNAANDTLSLLQSLSAQANLLMSNPAQSQPTSTSQSSTSGQDILPSESKTANTATSEGFNFLQGLSTLPPNFFSTSSKDALLLSSAFGPSIAQTFQSTSSLKSSAFPAVPSFPSSSDGQSDTQLQKSSSEAPWEKQYKSHKYIGEQSDEDTLGESSDEGDADSQGEESTKKDECQEEKDSKYDESVTNVDKKPLSVFDDESAWEDEEDHEAFDKATSLKTNQGPPSKSESQHSKEPATPPTSRLVSKLFPKLRPKPSVETEQKHQSLQNASSQPMNTAVGIQSGILREKLKELDAEIERFRSENSNLEKLRREREEGLAKLKQEIENFQKEKESELKRLEEFKAEEMKKLKRERKLFESYQKKLRSMPDKKEREEIENLKMQLQEVQEELKRKESRWTASTARLKNRVAELELENGEVREEVRILERKRLELMTSQAATGRNGSQASTSNGKVGGPSSIGGASVSSSRGQPGPRSSTPTRESELQSKDIGKKGAPMPTKSSMPAVTTGPNNNNNSSTNYNNNNYNTRGRGNKQPLGNNKINHNNPRSQAGPSLNRPGGMISSTSLSQHQPTQRDPPASTASLVAPSIPVTVLAPPAQAQQHQQQSQSHHPLRTSKEGGDGLQTMQNATVPVMMECTIPAGTDVSSMPGLQANPGSPDKSAARQAMEKAVVDKGDPSVFTENVHQDGKVEKTFRTGAKEIRFPNGTVKEISADGQTIVCRLANGDIRQILPDHRVVYIFSDAQIMQTTFPDGLETFQFQNGQIERRYPDGTVEITFPSKDIKYLFPDGGQEVILTDGTVMQYNSQGERTVEYPSGDREVHTAEFQRREFPDGIIKTIYADGRHETRFPNGRVRMRDKDGNIVMDQIVYR